MLITGSILQNRYRIVSPLGIGGVTSSPRSKRGHLL
jgi:hypothetical protein